jgi:hypothetical protein
MIFQIPMGLGKSRCDVPNGTIQGWVCLLNSGYNGSNILAITFDETIKPLTFFVHLWYKHVGTMFMVMFPRPYHICLQQHDY